MRITSACRPTAHALSICVHARKLALSHTNGQHMHCDWRRRYAINRNCRLKYTLDNNSTPTNKSEIKLNPLVWVKYRSQVVVPLIFFLILFVFLSFKYSYWFIFLVLLSLAVNVFYWLRVKEHLKAESTPGIVISIEPPLMAVYSNMPKYGEFYPAIKVESFNNLSNHQIGTRIATASTVSYTHLTLPTICSV